MTSFLHNSRCVTLNECVYFYDLILIERLLNICSSKDLFVTTFKNFLTVKGNIVKRLCVYLNCQRYLLPVELLFLFFIFFFRCSCLFPSIWWYLFLGVAVSDVPVSVRHSLYESFLWGHRVFDNEQQDTSWYYSLRWVSESHQRIQHIKTPWNQNCSWYSEHIYVLKWIFSIYTDLILIFFSGKPTKI